MTILDYMISCSNYYFIKIDSYIINVINVLIFNVQDGAKRTP